MRHGLELGPILHIRLDAQTGRKHELADGGAEAGQEGVEGLYFLTQHTSFVSPRPPNSSLNLPSTIS